RMVTYAVKYEAEGVLTTDWGDYGHLNLFANSMPLMIYAAATSWNPLDERSKDEHFKAISLLEYRDQSCR
ncbi:glycosyl hydrolase family 20, partial [Acinetobacter baumannii]